MNKMKNRTAFSLIEISIVILVIGLIVAGVTQASRLVNRATITSAQAATKSSPVALIDGLLFWIDSVSANSLIPSEVQDGGVITQWININPVDGGANSYNAEDATSETSNDRPTYVAKSYNGLPAIRFDGTNDVLQIGGSSNIGSILGSGDSSYSVFIVFATTTFGGSFAKKGIIGAGVDGENTANTFVVISNSDSCLYVANKWGDDSAGSYDVSYDCGSTGGVEVSSKQFVIASYIHDTDLANTAARSIYVNGNGGVMSADGGANGVQSWNSAASRNNNASPVLIGEGITADATFFGGDIAEIITYNRPLTSDERSDIESYLSKKWKIKLR